jgi:hypothetical protein
MNTRLNKFQRGAGVFSCRMCDRQTRGDGDAAGVRLCSECYENAGIENALMDGYEITAPDVATVEGNIKSLVAKRARASAIEDARGLLADLRKAVAKP